MRGRPRVLITCMFIAVVLVATGVMAQTTTGRIAGRVVDSDGAVLPGATVRCSSDVLIGGTRTTITDVGGEYQFVGLPPGVYSVRMDLDGFTPQERTDVKVPLGGTAVVDVTMPVGSFASEIQVTGETPVIDPTQVNSEQIFDQSYLKGAAIGSSNRSYQSILTQAAGVVDSSAAPGNPNVFGSSASENAYYIDGVDTTDPVTATFGTNFSFDAVQEIQFQTGGFEAEFGRATGGIVNLVTKSGGNSFSGTFDARYRDSGFNESGDHFDPDENEVKFQRFDATLGGPILRDRLWFFVSFSDIDSRTTPTAAPSTYKFLGNYYLGKATWQIADSWRTVLKYSGDPTDVNNANASRFVDPTGNRFQYQGGDIYSGELNAVLTDALLWNTTIGVNRQELNSYPQHGDLSLISRDNLDENYLFNSYPNQQYSERNRDDINTNLTWFVDSFGGSHEFKAGYEYSDSEFVYASCNTGTPDGSVCTAGQGGMYTQELGTLESPVPYLLWTDISGGTSTSPGNLNTLYVQDAWRPTNNLTLKLGVRWDQVAFDNDVGAQVVDMDKVQPRLGVAWDLTGDATNVVRASWGRFMHPSSLSVPNYAAERGPTQAAWLSCSLFYGATADECQALAADRGGEWQQGPFNLDPNGFLLNPWNVFGSDPSLIDPGLSATHADELIVAYERQLWPQSSVEISYVDKETSDIFDDTCSSEYPVPTGENDCSSYTIANLDGLYRDFRGLIVKLESRSWDWMTVLASYTWSESKGNINSTIGGSTAYDVYPAHYVNRTGYLDDHREHRVKLNGFFLLPLNFTIGFDAFWSSAFTWEPRADAGQSEGIWEGQEIGYIPYGNQYMEPAGNRDGDDAYGLDLEVRWGLPIGNTRLEFIASVYNVFSTEYVTGVCDDISPDDSGVEQYNGCGTDPDGNTLGLGDPITYRQPRRYEVGFRFEF